MMERCPKIILRAIHFGRIGDNFGEDRFFKKFRHFRIATAEKAP
jgi:hypothetical protein